MLRPSLVLAFTTAVTCGSPGSQPPVATPAEESTPAEVPDVSPEPADDPAAEPSSEAVELSLPDDVPPLDAECAVRRDFALNQLTRAVELSTGGCETDADCVMVGRSTDCMGYCAAIIHASNEAAFTAFVQDVDTRVCEGYRDSGCPYATPRCMKPNPACVEGTCTNAR